MAKNNKMDTEEIQNVIAYLKEQNEKNSELLERKDRKITELEEMIKQYEKQPGQETMPELPTLGEDKSEEYAKLIEAFALFSKTPVRYVNNVPDSDPDKEPNTKLGLNVVYDRIGEENKTFDRGQILKSPEAAALEDMIINKKLERIVPTMPQDVKKAFYTALKANLKSKERQSISLRNLQILMPRARKAAEYKARIGELEAQIAADNGITSEKIEELNEQYDKLKGELNIEKDVEQRAFTELFWENEEIKKIAEEQIDRAEEAEQKVGDLKGELDAFEQYHGRSVREQRERLAKRVERLENIFYTDRTKYLKQSERLVYELELERGLAKFRKKNNLRLQEKAKKYFRDLLGSNRDLKGLKEDNEDLERQKENFRILSEFLQVLYNTDKAKLEQDIQESGQEFAALREQLQTQIDSYERTNKLASNALEEARKSLENSRNKLKLERAFTEDEKRSMDRQIQTLQDRIDTYTRNKQIESFEQLYARLLTESRDNGVSKNDSIRHVNLYLASKGMPGERKGIKKVADEKVHWPQETGNYIDELVTNVDNVVDQILGQGTDEFDTEELPDRQFGLEHVDNLLGMGEAGEPKKTKSIEEHITDAYKQKVDVENVPAYLKSKGIVLPANVDDAFIDNLYSDLETQEEVQAGTGILDTEGTVQTETTADAGTNYIQTERDLLEQARIAYDSGDLDKAESCAFEVFNDRLDILETPEHRITKTARELLEKIWGI